MHASKKSSFRTHDDLGKSNDSNESRSLHVNMHMPTNYVPRKALFSTPNIDLLFISNPLKDELGFLDGNLG